MLMVENIREIFLLANNKVQDISLGHLVKNTLEIGSMAKEQDMVSRLMQMEINMKASGRMI